MSETAHELVQRGAALLDEKLPGWADQIDLESLEMASSCRCVLGQLGSRQVNLDRLSWEGVKRNPYVSMASALFEVPPLAIEGGKRTSQERDHGFYLGNADRAEAAIDYLDLQVAWRDEIRARRLP